MNEHPLTDRAIRRTESARESEGEVAGAPNNDARVRDRVALELRRLASAFMAGEPPSIPIEDLPELLADAATLIDGKTLQQAAAERTGD